jgi:hypothetical protein
LRHAPIVPFPLPAHRTGRADFPHPALQPTSREGMQRVSTLRPPTEPKNVRSVGNGRDPRERTLWQRLRLGLRIQLASEGLEILGLPGSSPIPAQCPRRCKHVGGRDPSLHRHYPASLVPCSPPTPGPPIPRGDVRVAIPTNRVSLVAHQPFSDMLSPLPRWTERVHLSITFPVRAAFPELGAGRRPQLLFSRPARRSLTLRPAGSLDRLRGLCHEASARPVA